MQILHLLLFQYSGNPFIGMSQLCISREKSCEAFKGSHASGRRQPWLPVPVLTNMLDTGQVIRRQDRWYQLCAFSKACCSWSHGWFLLAPHWGKIMNSLLVSLSKCLSSSCPACCNNAINQLGCSLLELETHADVVPPSHLPFLIRG